MKSRFVLARDLMRLARYRASVVQSRELPDGTRLARVEFPSEHALGAAEADGELVVFPALEAPVEGLPQAKVSRLAALGIAPLPGERILNTLRRLRDAYITEPLRFDISSDR